MKSNQIKTGIAKKLEKWKIVIINEKIKNIEKKNIKHNENG